MSPLLAAAIVVPTAIVVVALFVVLWRERRSRRDAWTALVGGVVLAVWAAVTAALAQRGFFHDAESILPLGVTLGVVALVLASSLAASSSLRSLLSRQSSLVRLHLVRLEGIVFLILMAQGQMPALWALPAGIGDILVAATAPWVARRLDGPDGRRRAITWNLLGMADLIVAVGLGIMTSAGPTQVFHTTPTAEIVTQFPLVLVPAFLVPLAFTLHVVSLWQLLGGTWARPSVESRRTSRDEAAAATPAS